jgi:hypothetical protein
MLKLAKIIAKKEGFDIIATGEVLGQRPMSQNAQALKLIEREAGLVGKILRPLSAKALPATQAEDIHLVDREHLCAFRGRSRKGQIELAKKFGVKNYPSPAGGCILTDKEYSKKLRDLLEKAENPKPGDLALLRLGRHFWCGSTKIILGRNHQENLALKKLAGLCSGASAKEGKGDILVEPKNFPGPTALIRGKKIEASIEASIESAKEKILKYAKKLKNKKPEFIVLNQK